MGVKTRNIDFHVEVDPEPPRYGSSDERWKSACEDVADQIRRHVDGINPKYGVSVVWKTEKVCEHCGSKWTEDSNEYNGGCCAKDVEPAVAPLTSASGATPST
jgi:hypothetical protein